MKHVFFIILTMGTIVFAACDKKDDTTSGGGNTGISCSGVTATYAANASPVIVSKCATNSSCHATGAVNSGGVLTTHAQIAARKDAIKAAIVNGSMPKNGTMTTAEKQAVVCWIDAGAMNN